MTAAAAWGRLALATGTAVALLLAVSPERPEARLAAPAAVAVGAAAGGVLSLVLRAPWLGQLEAAGRVTAVQAAFLLLFAASEEIVWRRVVLGELLRGGVPVALAGSTLGFALAHRARPALHLVTGLAFAAVYLGTGVLAASVAAHWAYNATLGAGRRAGGRVTR